MGAGEGLAHSQYWVEVVAAAVVVVLVLLFPQLQGVEEVAVQIVLWLEGVVVEGPLGLGVVGPGVLVGTGHPPQVQGAVDHNDPYYSPQ